MWIIVQTFPSDNSHFSGSPMLYYLARSSLQQIPSSSYVSHPFSNPSFNLIRLMQRINSNFLTILIWFNLSPSLKSSCYGLSQYSLNRCLKAASWRRFTHIGLSLFASFHVTSSFAYLSSSCSASPGQLLSASFLPTTVKRIHSIIIYRLWLS